MARAKTVQSIVASVSNAADATTRGAIDVRDKDGGIITLKFTNGVTGPTVACSARIMIAHDTGATPATGAAGATWKTINKFDHTTANNDIAEKEYQFGPAVMHVQVEFTGNTGQAVTVEAIASTVNYSA